QFWFSEEEKRRYARQGHPDIAAFHHDLYRGLNANGRWWVMEQQPGPVNWAQYNPAPLPGMVRLWTLEAMAHGAELVSYFRWRQAPFAQEQMHAGLLRPDRSDDVAVAEVAQARGDIALLADAAGDGVKQVALVFDYQSDWATDIQPQGQGFSALKQAFGYYSALRQLGLNVDIIPPGRTLDGYAMVVIPCMPIIPDGFVDQLADFEGPVLIGPRSGSKTKDFSIPANLAPGPLQRLIPLKVIRVESLRPGLVESVGNHAGTLWLEHIESKLEPSLSSDSGNPIHFTHDNIHYLGACPDPALLRAIVAELAAKAGMDVFRIPDDIRIRRNGRLVFALNYGPEVARLIFESNPDFLIGSAELPPAGLAVWRAPTV
ncbi:MAG: hypothetical protein RL481_1375, partial [Pseudomonadota bacterium]